MRCKVMRGANPRHLRHRHGIAVERTNVSPELCRCADTQKAAGLCGACRDGIRNADTDLRYQSVALADRKFAIVCRLYTGGCSKAGEAVSKTACGGLDSQPSVPEAG